MTKDEVKIKIKRQARRRVCVFCADKVNVLDYKDINRHQRFISERGKILPRRNTNLCAKHQRLLATAIRRARYIGLIEYCID